MSSISSLSKNDPQYAYLELAHPAGKTLFARFPKDGRQILELFNEGTMAWKVESNPKITKRFSEDGSQITEATFQVYLDHLNQKNRQS